MLRVPPKHASIFTTLRLADLRLPATGFAEIRRHATRAVEMQQEYRFLSSSRKSTSLGRAIVRGASLQTSYNDRIVNAPKRSQPRRPDSIVHSGFIGVSGRIDDQLWASQGSLARPTGDRAHCWQGFHDAGAY
jgi:hypothetical protein